MWKNFRITLFIGLSDIDSTKWHKTQIIKGQKTNTHPSEKPFKNTLKITVDFRMYLCLTLGPKRSPEGHLKSQIPLWSVQAFRTYT